VFSITGLGLIGSAGDVFGKKVFFSRTYLFRIPLAHDRLIDGRKSESRVFSITGLDRIGSAEDWWVSVKKKLCFKDISIFGVQVIDIRPWRMALLLTRFRPPFSPHTHGEAVIFSDSTVTYSMFLQRCQRQSVLSAIS